MNRQTARLAAAWLAAQASDNTRAAYGRDLRAFAAWCDDAGMEPLAATPDDLDRYRDVCLDAGASPATVTRRLSGVASFFRFAAGSGALDANPADEVDRPAPQAVERTTLDDAELTSLVDAAQTLGTKHAALVAMLALEGIKLGELLALNVPRVHIEDDAVSVDLDRRGEREQVTVSARTAAAVVAYLADRRRGPLFVGDSAVRHRSSRLTRFGADFLIKRSAAAAGIEKPVSASVLRRSYIDAERRAGTPLADISRHVGHRELRETTRLVDGPA